METPVGHVLKRIERYIGPERGVLERTERIGKLVSLFEGSAGNISNIVKDAYTTHLKYQKNGPSQDERANDVLKWSHFLASVDEMHPNLEFEKNPTLRLGDQHFFHGKDMLDPRLAKDISREGLETVLSAYLFAENRKVFKERVGSLDNYNRDLEQQQIEAVVRGLQGEHQQIDTGKGKTSVILPITTLIKTYTSPDQKVIFSADSALRTEEFVRFVRPLSSSLEDIGLEPVSIGPPKETDSVGGARKKELKKQIEKDAILDNDRKMDFSPETRKKIHDTELQVDIDRQLAETANTVKQRKVKKTPEITIYTHDTLVHTYQQNKALADNPNILVYMDEAHAPFDRGTPYVTTSDENLAFSPQQCRMATAEWVLHYVASHHLDIADTLLSKGSGSLNAQGEQKMRDIKITEIVNPNGKLYGFFSEAVEHIAEEYGIGKKDLMTLQGSIVQNITDLFEAQTGKFRPHRMSNYMRSIGEKISHIYREKDEIFTKTDEGKFTLRDGYQDELLTTHEYERDMSLAARAMMGSFKMLIPRSNSSSMTYTTFLHGMKDKVICYSGTLKDEGKNTNFASFLEDETKRKIHTIENRQKKTLPVPQLHQTRDQAEEHILNEITKDGRGLLLVSTESLEKAKMTAQKLKAQLGENLVIYIGPKPSGDLVKEREYDRFVQESLSSLAEGKIKAIISTGSVGVGMNIVRKDGSFPDIKVGLLGVPNSKLQLKQIIGRRRAPDGNNDNYFWHVGEDQLEKYISNYPEKHPSILGKVFGGEDRVEIYKQYETAKKDPKEMQKFILKLIVKSQYAIDTEYDREYDEYYESISHIFQDAVAEEVLSRKFGGRTVEELSDKERYILQNIVAYMGIPSEMYQGIQKLPSLMPTVNGNIKSRTIKLNSLVDQSDYIKTQTTEWMGEMYDSVETYVDNKYTESELSMFYPDGYQKGRFMWLDFSGGFSIDSHVNIQEQIGNIPGKLGIVPVRELPDGGILALFRDDTFCVPVRSMGSNLMIYPIANPPAVSFNRFPLNATNGAPLFVFSEKKTA